MARICGMPRPSSPTSQASASRNSTSLLALAWLPSLCFRRWMAMALTRPSRSEARQEKAAQPRLGLRQHQEGIAHRRRDEPLVAGEAVAPAPGVVAVGHGLRGVGAHVGSALLLGHAHAHRHAVLSPKGRKRGS
jgi:hypothetical protein